MQLQTHPAGWYADPASRHEARYWDGTRWTERVADRGVEGQDGLAGTAPSDATGPVLQAAGLPVAGWYADPALRHEARYWDGSTWTERVADHGREVSDSARAPAPAAPVGADSVAERAIDFDMFDPGIVVDTGVPDATTVLDVEPAGAYAAEWYPDPTSRHELRYFDGTMWTEHVANEGVTGVDPLVDGSPGDSEGADPLDALLASMAAPDDSNLAMTVTGETVMTGVAAEATAATTPAEATEPASKKLFKPGWRAELSERITERIGSMPRSEPAGVVGWIVVSGAALLGLGSLGPWAKASAPYVGEVAQSGTSGDGRFILVMAFLLAILGLGLVIGRLGRIVAFGALGFGTLAAIVCAVDMARISNGNYGLLQGVANVAYSTGIGLWACLVGALVTIVGGIVAVTQR